VPPRCLPVPANRADRQRKARQDDVFTHIDTTQKVMTSSWQSTGATDAARPCVTNNAPTQLEALIQMNLEFSSRERSSATDNEEWFTRNLAYDLVSRRASGKVADRTAYGGQHAHAADLDQEEVLHMLGTGSDQDFKNSRATRARRRQ
jgi:hypothetical protein